MDVDTNIETHTNIQKNTNKTLRRSERLKALFKNKVLQNDCKTLVLKKVVKKKTKTVDDALADYLNTLKI